MKKNILNNFIYAGAFLLLITSCSKHEKPLQNLIINGSAELAKYDTIPPDWINVQGHWVSAEGDSARHDCAFAQNGKYLFFAGYDTLGILQQDVDIAEYSKDINTHKQQFIFNGYVYSLNQGPNSDQAQIILSGLDSSKTKIANIFNTDSTRSLNKWRLIADTFFAPASTKFVRIQLIAIRHVGGDNDGYFDNMVLNAIPVENNMIRYIIIAVAVFVLAIVSWIIIKQRNKKSN
ncbi:MAG TPA: hypothetical protein VIJ92_13395 [Ginsengibacter sp.]